MKRLPFANVAPYVADLNIAALAKAAGVHESTASGWRRPDRPNANISEDAADRLTITLGLALDYVWPDYYADLERRCDLEECSAVFVPRRRDQRFCSKKCRYTWRDRQPGRRERANAAKRKRYAEDKAYAEELRRRNAEYTRDRANRRAINAKARARYHRRKRAEREQVAA